MMSAPPDLILYNGRITTLDRTNPTASAVAIMDGRFVTVGEDHEVLAKRAPNTRCIDLKGRSVLPGLSDSHLHLIRGGLNFNMELRWDGVRSLADAMAMLRQQVAVTPAPQWVRVVGGFAENQFAERRLPTIDELNAAAPDTPVFILHLYDRALLNGAALRAVGYTKDTRDPPSGEIVRDKRGNPTGLIIARPNAGILYATLAKGPKLPVDYQLNSTRHFMRELNRLGVTGAIDAGGGTQNYPEDYQVIQKLAAERQLTVRIWQDHKDDARTAHGIHAEEPASCRSRTAAPSTSDLYRRLSGFRVERPQSGGPSGASRPKTGSSPDKNYFSEAVIQIRTQTLHHALLSRLRIGQVATVLLLRSGQRTG